MAENNLRLSAYNRQEQVNEERGSFIRNENGRGMEHWGTPDKGKKGVATESLKESRRVRSEFIEEYRMVNEVKCFRDDSTDCVDIISIFQRLRDKVSKQISDIWTFRLKSTLYLQKKVPKAAREAIFYILLENLRDRGNDRFLAIVFS